MKRFVVLAVLAAACRADGPTESSPVKSIAVTVNATQIVVGGTTQANAVLFDAQGLPVLDRPPTWTSPTPAVLGVNSSGVVTGLQAGVGIVRASAGAVAGEAQIVVRNPQAGSITLSRDSATIFIPDGAVQLIPTVKDLQGNIITNPTIFWQSTAPLIATVNATGLVTGVAVGTTTVRASIDGRTASTTITVLAAPNPGAPLILAINPLPLRPGGTYSVVGNNFGATAASNAVVVDGVAVTVNLATANGLSITLPTAGFTCDPSRTVFVQITANGQIGGGSATLQVPNLRTLSPGQSVVISSQSDVRCNELPVTGGRYVLGVYNAYRTAVVPGNAGSAAVTVRGAVGAPTTGALVAAPGTSGTSGTLARAPARDAWRGAALRAGGLDLEAAAALRRARARETAHLGLLERNLEFLRARAASLAPRFSRAPLAGRPAPAPTAAAAAVAVAAQIATVGAITPLKIPNVDVTTYCSSNFQIGVRTVFVGQHSIIVEDTVSVFNGRTTLQGQMNATFTQLGLEFENVMWPILVNNFGNPLVLDSLLSRTGKVVMVFSPRVNTFQEGRVLGFTVTCDFTPVSQSPSSNVGEYFYATVPTSAVAGYGDPESRESWLRLMRATVIHEVKHVTAFGERLARSFPVEDLSWEEGMARNVEELYARTFYGTQARQNTSYAASVGCDLRFPFTTPPECTDRPLLMLRHFDGLEQYFPNPESLSPLGRTFASDASFYASAWAIQRWATDHSATSESQFLRDWTVSATTGVQNLEARTGRTWEELLGEWTLAMFLDDVPAFTPENPRLGMPSWNMRDVFQGLCNDLGPCANPNTPSQLYPRASPFSAHPLQFGAFSTTRTIVGGSFSLFELTGTQTGRQVIELRGPGGGDPAGTVRLAIVRVQ
ncbi:MAG TPA: Ig-like domain-containing protein [Gemmatimonadaceae bacterium]|nr:Ig-like domain-containing protein [Gemmatimonadaceae bacterium]